MTRVFALRLLERVVLTFVLAILATYTSDVLGGSVPSLHALLALSLGHKALVAGVAAVAQLVISTLVAPHVGDPNSPDLLPGWLLKKVDSIEPDVKGAAAVVEKEDPGLLRNLTSLGPSNLK